MNTSNTGDNRPGTFRQADPRINRKGRPKDFDALRALAQEIAHEKAHRSEKDGGGPIVFDGHTATVAEVILRQWAKSGDWQRQKGFMEIAFGKVPDQVNVGFNFAKMTDDQLAKFIEGALAAIGASTVGGATAGSGDSPPAVAFDLPGVHPAG